MDRISNKFKLVRSQSIGVGMGGGEPKSTPAVPGSQTRPAVAASEGRTAQIILLDERRLELQVAPRLFAGELLDLVASQSGLKAHTFTYVEYVETNFNQ